MSIERLDRWLPRPAIRTYHHRRAATSGERLWQAAGSIELRDAPTLGRLVRWRIPDSRPEQTFFELFASYPFTVLERGPQLLVSGLCGRVWTLARDYPALAGPEEFSEWRLPGTVRVVFCHVVRELDAETAEISSEARVEPVDRAARRRLRMIWALVGRYERLIGAEALEIAARRAGA